jgi:hypothetical protein
MTPIYRILGLLLLIICVLLTAGCAVQIDNKNNVRLVNLYSITPQTPAPTAIPIPSTPVPPSIYWIKIDPISDKQIGDNFTISAKTNLSSGKDVDIQVFQRSWHPGRRYSEWSGAVGQVKVLPGRDGDNFTSFNISLSEFNADTYLVSEFALDNSATTESQFNVSPRK